MSHARTRVLRTRARVRTYASTSSTLSSRESNLAHMHSSTLEYSKSSELDLWIIEYRISEHSSVSHTHERMHRRLATFAHSRRLVTLGLASVWCLSGFKERRKECRGDSKRCVKESNIFLHSQKRVQKNVTRFFDIKKCQKIA